MMKILVAMLTIASAFVLSTGSTWAQDYPFCLTSCSYGSCTFSTLQQCQATVSGLEGRCEANPYYRQTNGAPGTENRRRAKRRF